MNHPVIRKISKYQFELVEPFTADGVTVPAGFKTDGASVPRIFWTFFNPCGELFEAAVIHDYQYRFKIGTKKEADKRFHRIAKMYGAKRAIFAYWGVKLGGSW